MIITKTNIIGELVANDYRTAEVFKKYKIDFCCNGKRTIEEACLKKGIELSRVINDLNDKINTSADSSADYGSWPIDLLADYIEKKHHRYIEEKTPLINQYLDKLCKVHGPHHPELFEIAELFGQSAAELSVHMKKEELVLFPFIRKMVMARKDNQPLNTPHFGNVEFPVRMLMHDHDTEGERFRKIAELTNNYTAPGDACNTYRVTYALLKEFEDDLHLHIHLENNILFPKSMEMEKSMNQNIPV